MNLLLLLVGAQPWKAPSSLEKITRVFAAISVFSLEMQGVTWLHVGSIRTLPAVNIIVAILAFVAWRPTMRQDAACFVRVRNAVPLTIALTLGALVITLNLGLPLEGADPYHLEKAERIARVGTLAYDTQTARKINVLNSLYETLLADLRLIPAVGPLVIRLHGVWGLLLYLIAIGAVRELLEASGTRCADETRRGPGGAVPSPAPQWPWAAMLLMPVLFHQLVLIKNDLFVAVAGLVTLTWVVTRAGKARWPEIAWASWLAGMAVAVKLTTLPLLAVLGFAFVLQRRRDWKAIAGVALGALGGMAAGGLVFTLVENVRVYGAIMPVSDQERLNTAPVAMLAGLSRFGISLVDFGVVTRAWWPGRGGWGSSFGLPLLWSVAVVAWSSRRSSLARHALLCAAAYFLAFAAVFPDADLAHRLALAPALLLIAVAVSGLERGEVPRVFRAVLVPVALLSSAQIARSAVLYFMR